MAVRRARPSREILSGDSADVYFARAERILEREGLDPVVTMEVFTRQDAVLCGIDEVKNLLAHALEHASPEEAVVEAPACMRRRCSACSPSRRAGPPRRRNASRQPRRSR